MEPARGNGSSNTREPSELLQAMHAQLEAGIALAREGVAAAARVGEPALEQFFERCLRALEHAQENGRTVTPEPPREEVSTAAFAPGDGASDADVTPEEARGKPGGWPAY